MEHQKKGKNSMGQPKVAVVIPIYNVENYLCQCLDSVLGQMLREIEIICVDDGSTDGSGRILDEYAKQDHRVIVIHKNNEGYGKAVNVGIDTVSAPYFGIVESDDFIAPEMYQRLYSTMLQTDADVIKCDYYSFYERDGQVVRDYQSLRTDGLEDLYRRVLHPKETPQVLLYLKSTWTGLYRTEFIRTADIRHNESPGAAYQDNGFWFQTMVKAQNIFFLDEAFYHYRQDNIGASYFNRGIPMAELDEYQFIESKLNEMGEEGKQFRVWLSYNYLLNGFAGFIRTGDQYKKQVGKRIRAEFLRFSEQGDIDIELFPEYVRIWLFNIVSNPSQAAQLCVKVYDSFIGKLEPFEKYVIYGAGKWARRLFEAMKTFRLHRQIQCFAVSDMAANPERIDAIPVKKIEDCEIDDETLVIIAVKKDDGIRETLAAAGVQNIVHYNELVL